MTFADLKSRLIAANPAMANDATKMRLTVGEFWRFCELAYEAGRESNDAPLPPEFGDVFPWLARFRK